MEKGTTLLRMAKEDCLLNALRLRPAVPTDERIENREDVAAIFDHAGENVAQFGFTLRIAMPLGQHRGRHFNIAAELLSGMSAQKESVEKCGLALRKFKFRSDRRGNELCLRGRGH